MFHATLARHTGIIFRDTWIVIGGIVVLVALYNCLFTRHCALKTRGDMSVWKWSHFQGLHIWLGGTFGVPYQVNRKSVKKTQGHIERFRLPSCRLRKNNRARNSPDPGVGAPTCYLCESRQLFFGEKSLSPNEKIFFLHIAIFDHAVILDVIWAYRENFFRRSGMHGCLGSRF